MEDRNLTILIQESISWCFNTLNELIDTSSTSKAKDSKEISKDDIKKENQVILYNNINFI